MVCLSVCDKVTAVVEFNPDINKFNELLSSEINGKIESKNILKRSHVLKVFFFSESTIRFLDLQISKKNIQKNYLELEI